MTKSFEQLMNEGFERKLGLLNESLDEALPKDFIKNMKQAQPEDRYSHSYDANKIDYEYYSKLLDTLKLPLYFQKHLEFEDRKYLSYKKYLYL